jgi:hypothetical protein
MGRTACIQATLGLLLGVVFSGTANAQTLPPPIVTTSHVVLPPVPQLHLSWPITPLRFSFSAADELTGYATGPLQLYRAESLWLAAPALQLLTASSSERAFELDCRLTCQPIVKRAFDLEARVPLPVMTSAIPSSYAFLRSSSFRAAPTQRFTQQLSAGWAGALNF